VMVCAPATGANAATANAAIHAIRWFIVYPLPLVCPAFAKSCAKYQICFSNGRYRP